MTLRSFSRRRAHVRRLAAILLLACTALLAPACGDAEEKQTIVYAGSAWFGHAPAWVGIQKGIFAKHGFEVEQRSFGASSFRVNALENGDAQFASLGQVAMLSAMAADRRDFYWVGCQNNAPGNEGLVAVGGIKRIEDLKGKRIALPQTSSAHLTVALLLEDAGLDITKDVTVIPGTDATIPDILAGGDADAGITWEPHYARLVGLPDSTLLATDEDTSIYKQFGTMTGPDVICASRAWVDADPARAKKFFQAYWEACVWCRDHPDELVELVAKHLGKTEPGEREAVERTLRRIQWTSWADQADVMSTKRMLGQAKAAAGLLARLGMIDKEPSFLDWTRLDWFRAE